MLMFPSKQKSGGVTISSMSAYVYKSSGGYTTESKSNSVPIVNQNYSSVSVGTVTLDTSWGAASVSIKFYDSSSAVISSVAPTSNSSYAIPSGTKTIEVEASASISQQYKSASASMKNIVIS